MVLWNRKDPADVHENYWVDYAVPGSSLRIVRKTESSAWGGMKRAWSLGPTVNVWKRSQITLRPVPPAEPWAQGTMWGSRCHFPTTRQRLSTEARHTTCWAIFNTPSWLNDCRVSLTKPTMIITDIKVLYRVCSTINNLRYIWTHTHTHTHDISVRNSYRKSTVFLVFFLLTTHLNSL